MAAVKPKREKDLQFKTSTVAFFVLRVLKRKILIIPELKFCFG